MAKESELFIEQVSGIPDAGPRIKKLDLIIIHHTGVSAEEAIKLFKKSRGKSSSHYLITKTGEVKQFIADDRLANHLSGKQPEKQRSLGIELENSGRVDDPYPPAQYAALNKLLSELERKHKISHDNDHIKGHYEVDYNRDTGRKWDPSPNFDWTKVQLSNHPTLKTVMGNVDACTRYYDLWEKGCTDKCAKYGMKVGDYATGQTCKIIFSK